MTWLKFTEIIWKNGLIESLDELWLKIYEKQGRNTSKQEHLYKLCILTSNNKENKIKYNKDFEGLPYDWVSEGEG